MSLLSRSWCFVERDWTNRLHCLLWSLATDIFANFRMLQEPFRRWSVRALCPSYRRSGWVRWNSAHQVWPIFLPAKWFRSDSLGQCPGSELKSPAHPLKWQLFQRADRSLATWNPKQEHELNWDKSPWKSSKPQLSGKDQANLPKKHEAHRRARAQQAQSWALQA